MSIELFSFSEILVMLKRGVRASRRGWNGKGQYIAVHMPTTSSKNTLPYIYIVTVRGDRVPWLASQSDLLCSDWVPVECTNP